jgi:hypothetical protein
MLSHLTEHLNPRISWRARFVDLMDGFPAKTSLTPEHDMGFPEDWRSLPVWASSK